MSEKPPIDPAVVALQSRMFQHRLKVTKVCERADVNPSTWTRWADGTPPNTATLRKMEAAVDQLVAEAGAKP